MPRNWSGKTFGNGWMHRSLIRILRYMDVRILYGLVAVFVIPVCLTVNPSRRIIYRYLRRRHRFGRLKSAWLTYINHCLFGQVVIDRFAMYAGKHFEVDIEGQEDFFRYSDCPEGFLVLSAHVGNYELAGYSISSPRKRLNALVFSGEKDSVMQNRRKLFSSMNVSMIPVREDMSHLFEINAALTSGEIVSMPSDRMFGSERHIVRDFLGAPAQVPYGPFSIATLRGLKVMAINVVKTGWKRYRIIVTPLPYPMDASRTEQVEELSAAYVRELERIVRLYPTQWYNYFEFWENNGSR